MSPYARLFLTSGAAFALRRKSVAVSSTGVGGVRTPHHTSAKTLCDVLDEGTLVANLNRRGGEKFFRKAKQGLCLLRTRIPGTYALEGLLSQVVLTLGSSLERIATH